MYSFEQSNTKGVFWQSIVDQLHKDEISHYDLQTLQELAIYNKWIDMIPRGLVHSYSYLYHCVKGLGCEDGEAIEKDVLRTVGAVKDGPKVFGDTSELGKAGTARAMHRVLTAISITDSMGYCQGMNYVADYLLKFTSEEETFCLFLFALRNRHLCCLYETKLPILSEFMEVFEMQLNFRLPLLAATLRERGFIAPFYSIEWFTTLFTLACPPDLTAMVLDLFFAGLQDVQIRCGIAIMEILEPQLLLMSVEELLKEFRHMCQGVKPEEVIIRALRIQLVPVRLCHSGTPPRSSYLIDCEYEEDKYAEILLSLRLRYISEARAAMQERDADCGRWIKDRTSRSLAGPTRVGADSPRPAQSQTELRLVDGIEGSIAAEVVVSEVLGTIVNELSIGEETSAMERASLYLSSSRYRDTIVDPDPTVHQEYFEFLTDPQLMSSAYELKQILVMCDRITQWVQLNQKWVDCLGYMKSELAKYNMADHLLRYAITHNSHVRTVLFLLAVAGADPNSQDRWLRTPLHYAASYNRPDVVRLLLLAGADPTVRGALRPPQLDQVPSTVTSAVQHVLQNGSPCMTVLKGKSCVSCNVLFHGSSLQKRSCSTCDISLCSACLDTHYCVWQHGSVAGARDRSMQPVNAPNRARYRSSSLSGTSDDDAPELSASGSSSEPALQIFVGRVPSTDKNNPVIVKFKPPLDCEESEIPIDDHVGVVLSGNDVSVGNETVEKDILIASKSDGDIASENEDDNGSVDSGFGSVEAEGQSRLESHDRSADVSSSHSVPKSRRRSMSLMSWLKSNKLTRSARTVSADALGADPGRVSSEIDSGSLRPPSRIPSSELQGASNISRKKRLSMALGSSLKKLKGMSRRKNSNGQSSQSRRRGAADDIPLYWVGYRDDESYLIRLQPWQALLLPLVLGAEENRSSMSLDDLRLKGNSCPVEVHAMSTPTLDEADGSDLYQTRLSTCDICEMKADECLCGNKSPLKKSSHISAEPMALYFRQEMAFFYALLKRDADMLSLHNRKENVVPKLAEKWPDQDTAFRVDISNSPDMMDSSNFDQSLAEHLTPRADNLMGIFDSTYTTFPSNSTGKSRVDLTKENSADGVSAAPSPVAVPSTVADEGHNSDGSDEVDQRLMKSQQSLEALRQGIVRQFVRGCWTVGEEDEFWVPDDSVWYCKCCATQFTLFQRKHHCRRCGGVFCADDAPHVDMTECLPDSFHETLRILLTSDSNIDKKQFRLCASCKTDMRHCTGLLTEIDITLPSYTLAFWLSTLSSKNPSNTLNGEEGDKYSPDWKEMRLGRFPVAGQWVDSMADWLWRDKVSNIS